MVDTPALVETPALAQRKTALKRANRIRSARAQMKEQIKSGELDICDLILDPPDDLVSATIGEVVEWAPGIGRWRSTKVLTGVVRPTVRMGELGDYTRQRIVSRVREWGPVA